MRPCDGVDERIKHQGHLPDPLHVPCMVERRWVVGWSDELGLLGLLAPLRNLSPAGNIWPPGSVAPKRDGSHLRRLTRRPPAQCAYPVISLTGLTS